jgi:hypothetical protein
MTVVSAARFAKGIENLQKSLGEVLFAVSAYKAHPYKPKGAPHRSTEAAEFQPGVGKSHHCMHRS